ncbi:hypothetical protein PENSTE_c012G07455 [Penicillium steckii]|uniref:HTH CENPB-type domain-containing protein n=1 Tax=Penicillium steckii TaxID=303698 RepID=A0A1V6T414_9EURO|nr:hypothetical protein PENSTE_c012G07455 [Penicillium steckii]
MSTEYQNSEARIQQACATARATDRPNFAALAREYRVSAPRLRARFNGRAPRNARQMAYKRLNNEQEASLVAWIRRLDSLYIPPTAGMVIASANALLRRASPPSSPPAPLGKDWVYRFVKERLPNDLNWVKQRPADQKRMSNEDIGILTAWYERLEPLLKRIPPKHIYNFDETGFALGQGRSQNVISQNKF